MSFLLATPLLFAVGLAPPSGEVGDLRSTVLLDLDCASRLDHRQVTLYANGTVRLRQGPRHAERLHLLELGPEELDAVVRSLGEDELDETPSDLRAPEGEWVERCEVLVELPEAAPRRIRFGRFASLTLALSRVVETARELGRRAEERAAAGGLPSGYAPRPGDVLRRADGVRFEVVGFTADGTGVELQGIDAPLTVFVAPGDLGRHFVGLEDPRSPRR